MDSNISADNYTFEDFIALFGSTSIDLNSFWLMNVGFNNASIKQYCHLIIRGYAIRPFYGPHLVSIFTTNGQETKMETLWVHSLTYLRREIFGFQDRLSFERSSFLIPHKDGRLLLRLKSIRGFLSLPHLKLETVQTSVMSPRRGRDDNKVQQLLNHNIQNLITFISREKNMDLMQSTTYFSLYCKEYCSTITNQFS
jgi:hypothetical protein